MASTLPSEILFLIFGHFCSHCSLLPRDDRVLFSLCLVSRRFRAIAQPILYHQFIPGYGDPWGDRHSWDRRLTSFVRTIQKRRDLAVLVRWVYLHPCLLSSVRDVLDRSPGDWLAILIAQLPNLDHCSLQVDMFPGATVHTSGLRAAGVTRLPLRTIDVSCHSTARSGQRFSLDSHARSMIELSTGLETLNLHMCGSTWSHAPFPSLPNLKTLRLSHSRLTEECLERLLASCPGLRSFFYEAASPYVNRCDRVMSYGNDHFRLFQALRSLTRYRASLKSLHLDLRYRCLTVYAHPQNIPAALGLKNFTALEHLFFTANGLYCFSGTGPSPDPQLLVQLLPPGIKSLHLTGYVGRSLLHLARALLVLADAVLQGQFPCLKQVRCDTYHNPGDDYSDELGGAYVLDTMLAAAGVDFGYESFPISQATLGFDDRTPSPTSLHRLPCPDMD